MSDDLDPKVRAELRALARLISKQDEKINALSRARQLDVSSIPVTVEDNEGAQETIDVPLNVGVSQGVHALGVANDAAERVDEAQADAAEALAEAVRAGVTADGKNTIYGPSEEEPEAPEGGFSQGDQWARSEDGNIVEMLVWNGTEWKPLTILANELIVVGDDGIVRVADGRVTADSLAVDALNFKTATGLEIAGGLVTGSRFEGGHFSLSDSTITSTIPRYFDDPLWAAPHSHLTNSELTFLSPDAGVTENTKIEYYSGTGTGGGNTGPSTRLYRYISRFDPAFNPDYGGDAAPYLDYLLPLWATVMNVSYLGEYSGADARDVKLMFYGRKLNESVNQVQLSDWIDSYDFNGEWRFHWEPPEEVDIHRVVFSVPRNETLTISSEHIAYVAVAGESLQWSKDQAAAYPGLRAYREDQSLHYEILPSGIKFWDTITGDSTFMEGVDGGVRFDGPLLTPQLTATSAMVAAGTDNSHYVTPAGLGAGNLPMARIDSVAGSRPRIATRASGWTHLTDSPYDGLQAEVKSGVLYVSGGLARSSSHAGSATVLILEPGYRPQGAVVQFAYMTGQGAASNSSFIVVQPDGIVIIAHARTGSGNLMFGFSYPI